MQVYIQRVTAVPRHEGGGGASQADVEEDFRHKEQLDRWFLKWGSHRDHSMSLSEEYFRNAPFQVPFRTLRVLTWTASTLPWFQAPLGDYDVP